MGLLAHYFDTAFAAPDGIQKLRELILTLAMQGKLVPQDPNDQPVKELLLTIDESRKKMLAERKVTYRDISAHSEIDSMKYEIPAPWSWVQFKDVVFFQEGPGIRKWQFTNEGIKLLNVSNILADGSLDFSNSDKYVSIDEFTEKYNHFEIFDGDLLFASSGGSWGKVSWYVNPGFRAMLNTSTIRLRFFDESFEPNYLYYFLKTNYFRRQLSIQLVGMQPNFGSTHLSRIYIPIPPLAEQRRIVAKIDQLMARCDQLEKLRSDRAQKLITVHTAALDRLLTAQDSDDFSTAWRFITQHFGALYSVKETVAELRKTILQLAVMGKLVPQDPNDEPALLLLEQTKAQKEQLIKQKKLKKQWILEPVEFKEILYQLPPNWCWIRVLEGVQRVTVGHVGSMQNEYLSEGIPFLRSQNVRENRYDSSGLKFISKEFHKQLAKSKLNPKDVVVVRSGNVGTTCVIPEDLQDANCSDLVIIKSPIAFNSYFLSYYMNSAAKSHVEAGTVGIALTHFNTQSVAELPIPLPPLAEQHRIVAKIDQLMVLCDRLEAAISSAQAKQTDLLNAEMAQV